MYIFQDSSNSIISCFLSSLSLTALCISFRLVMFLHLELSAFLKNFILSLAHAWFSKLLLVQFSREHEFSNCRLFKIHDNFSIMYQQNCHKKLFLESHIRNSLIKIIVQGLSLFKQRVCALHQMECEIQLANAIGDRENRKTFAQANAQIKGLLYSRLGLVPFFYNSRYFYPFPIFLLFFEIIALTFYQQYLVENGSRGLGSL